MVVLSRVVEVKVKVEVRSWFLDRCAGENF